MSQTGIKGPVAWMAQHGVAPNLLMVFLILGGFVMSLFIRKEFIPPTDADLVSVSVAYPGATPAEMEQAVILPIENQLGTLNGLAEISSTASQGSANVRIELENNTDLQRAYQDILQAVSKITTFPAGMEQPVIFIPGHDFKVVELVMYGPVDRFALKRLGEFVEEQLLLQKNVSRVEMKGVPEEELHIEIDQSTLQRYNLTLNEVAQKIRANAFEQSAGTVKTDGGDILVTLDDRIYWAEQYERLPIVTDSTGVVLELGDVASVQEGFSDINRLVTYEGQMSLGFNIYRSEQQTPLTVAEAVRDALPEIASKLPEGIELIITDDNGETYQQRVGLLMKNAFIGLALVLILLSLFLEYRLAFWVTMGIPTSFLGALLLLPSFDVSINMISMFAFIVALGIVVDDAIIAGENIYEHMQKGMPFMDAAVQGAREVAVPLSFAILTNVAAFLPLLALPGIMGKLFVAIPVVVVCCFLISWIEALFILPTHLAHLQARDREKPLNRVERLQRHIDRGLQKFITNIYAPVIEKTVRWPALTLTLALSIMLIVLAYAGSGRMGFSMFPRLEGEFVVATATLPSNAPMASAERVRERMESALRRAVEPVEAGGQKMLISVEGDIRGDRVEIEGRLVDGDARPIHANELVKLWRGELGEMAGVRSITFDAERGGGPSGGAGLTIEVRGSRIAELQQASAELTSEISQLSNVLDVANGFTSGKPQWDIELNDLGRSLGLQANDVAGQIRAALYGARALRQQRDSSEVTVLVRLPDRERERSADIERLMIKTPAGSYVLLSDIAFLKKSQSQALIQRRNGRQIVNVTAEVEPRERVPALMEYLRAETFPQLSAKYPSIEFGFSGRQARTEETMSSLKLYGGFALLLIYAMLAIPFRSYSQPLLIMAVIPFGAAGAIAGHILLGYGLSIMSIMGIVALAGVVVNDSLILIEYANRQRVERGLSAAKAVVEAGMRRFRPILLTTLTTFGGLAPMVFETSRQAQFITPMAVSLGFGILFTTFVCLLVLPALYISLDNLVRRIGLQPRRFREVGNAQ